jgi:CubicO group peptidase (beta-lactamase class C family)
MKNLSKPTSRLAITFAAISLCSLSVAGRDAPKPDQPQSATRPPGAPSTQPTEPSPATAGRITDPGDLEAFFDGAVNLQLESKHIAGAVVAVVADGKPVFAKGYGYADIEGRKKVEPETTLFRVGSISKLFTWTAVMQLVEEGKLDLDADLNQYMKDVQIPPTYEQPITLKHLLTHTPGFEDSVIGLFARTPEKVRPLGEVLRAELPMRVRPPGVLASYSNHGTGLAGYVVACVSGMPWEDYTEQRILKPLGMEHTLVRQPPEDQLPAGMSKGYKWDGSHFEVKGFEYIPLSAAGCISMSGGDAAKFMLAYLQDGHLGSGRILQSETARRMREPLFQHHPKTSAMCYGFMEQRKNDLRILGHGGATLWFHSLMQLIPERGVGLFISYNTQTGGRQHSLLFDDFLKRYFPQADPPRIKPPSDFRERADRLKGEYGVTRYSHSSVAKLAALTGAFDVSVNKDDTITVTLGDDSRRYVEVEPFVFRELDGPGQVVFKEDERGRVRYLFRADAPSGSAIRREWYELSWVQLGLLGGSLAIFASALLFWPAIAFSVRGLTSPRIKRTWFSGVLSCLAWFFCTASIALMAALAFVLSDGNEIVFGLTPLMRVLLAVTQVCAVLAAVTVLACIPAWLNRYWRLTGRLHYTLVALAGVGFVWFLYYWNLLTFGFSGLW